MVASKSFDCPNCSNSLHYQGGEEDIIQCANCASSIIVPKELRTHDSLFQNKSQGLDWLANKSDDMAQLGRLVAEGKKIEAIKIYREVFCVGLKESKEAVDKMMRGESIAITHTSRSSSAPTSTGWTTSGGDQVDISKHTQLGKLVAENKTNQAIRLYREMHNVNYREAREAIEKLMRGESVTITHTSESSSSPSSSGWTFSGGDASEFAEYAQLGALIGANKKIEAIKLYRQMNKVSLKTAKEAVEKMMRGESVTVSRTTTVETSPSSETWKFPNKGSANFSEYKEFAELVIAGNSKQAARLYQDMYDVGVSEANEAVNKLAKDVGSIGRPSKNIFSTLTSFLYTLLMVLLPFILIINFMPNNPIIATLGRINPFAKAKLVQTIGSEESGPGYFTGVNHVAVDIAGNIYTAESGLGRIQKFNPAGEFVTQWLVEEGAGIQGLAVNRQGVIYALVGAEIFTYDSTNGLPLGQLEYSEGWGFEDIKISTDGAIITVWGGDIVSFDSQGNVVAVISEAIYSQSGDSELDTLVAVDGIGNIYALGVFNNAVFKFSPDGIFITRFGRAGTDTGQFQTLSTTAIAVDQQGNIYVSDLWGILVFSSDGNYLHTIRVEGRAMDMTFNHQNELIVVTTTQKVLKYHIKE